MSSPAAARPAAAPPPCRLELRQCRPDGSSYFLATLSLPLQPGQSLDLGRAEHNPVQFSDPTISARHCRIACTPEGLRLQDLGSRNGTRLNGVPLLPGQEAHLQPGDCISLAHYQLRCYLPSALPAPEDD